MQPIIDSDPKQTEARGDATGVGSCPSAHWGGGLAIVLAFFGLIAFIVVSALATMRSSAPARWPSPKPGLIRQSWRLWALQSGRDGLSMGRWIPAGVLS